MKPLAGIAPAIPREPDELPAPRTRPETLAAVTDRDADGLPTRIEIPGPLAGGKVGLWVDRIWAADVLRDGTLVTDGTRGDLLAKLKPGVRLVASTTAAGVVAVSSTGNGKVREHGRA
jgi:hypothetical protein